MSYAYKQGNKRQAISGTITGLMQELQKLAPHPDRANHNGPLFIKSNPNFKIANDHDGMLGTMMMESLLGTAFSEAVSEAFGSETQEALDTLDLASVMECYSEYISDVEGKTQHAAAHGQGTMARMSGKSISSGFNMRSEISAPMQAFYDDLPKRISIERSLAHHAKQLEFLDAPMHQQAPEYNVPRPSFAA